jgi:hypothetical protein
MLMWFLIVYAIGFVISIIALHAFKDKLGVNHYDPPHPEYDDYSSNASAFLSFSLAWPIFWTFISVSASYGLMLRASEEIGNLFSKDSIKTKNTEK